MFLYCTVLYCIGHKPTDTLPTRTHRKRAKPVSAKCNVPCGKKYRRGTTPIIVVPDGKPFARVTRYLDQRRKRYFWVQLTKGFPGRGAYISRLQNAIKTNIIVDEH